MPTPRDPMDDFEMIDPGDRPRRARPGPRPDRDRPRRRAPERNPSNRWILAAVIVVVGVFVVGGSLLLFVFSNDIRNAAIQQNADNAARQAQEARQAALDLQARQVAPVVLAAPVAPADGLSPAAAKLAQGDFPAFRLPSPADLPAWTGKSHELLQFENRRIGGLCVAARGRYLFLTVSGTPEIQMIDLTTGKKVRSIPFVEAKNGSLYLLGGVDVLVAYNVQTHVVTSWPLDALDAPIEVRLPSAPLHRPMLGAGTNGPLLVSYLSANNPLVILDPLTLAPVAYKFDSVRDQNLFPLCRVYSINSTGTLLATSGNTPGSASYLYWKIDDDTIRPVPLEANTPHGGVLSLSGAGDRVVGQQKAWDLPAGREIPGLSQDTYGQRNFSVDSEDELMVSCPPNRDMVVQTYRRGSDLPAAKLYYDIEAEKAAKGMTAPVFRDESWRVFSVGRTDVVVVAGPDSCLIWHADPERQKAGKLVLETPITPVSREISQGLPPAFRPVSTEALPKFVGPPLELVVALGGEKTFARTCVGGRGRYFFYTTEDSPSIGRIDLATAKELAPIACPFAGDRETQIVAGADFLVAIDGGSAKVVSWPLANVASRIESSLPSQQPGVGNRFGTARVATMGPRSNGPLFVTWSHDGGRMAILDPATLKPVRYAFDSQIEKNRFGGSIPKTIDATGRFLVATAASGGNTREYWRIEDGKIRALPSAPELKTQPPVALFADGQRVLLPDGIRRLDGSVPPAPIERGPTELSALSQDADDELAVSVASTFASPDIRVWKPGQKEPLARLTFDFPSLGPNSPLVKRLADGPVAVRWALCLSGSNLVVVGNRSRLLFWDFSPAANAPAVAVAPKTPAVPPRTPVVVPPKTPAVVPPKTPALVPPKAPVAEKVTAKPPSFKKVSESKLPRYTGQPIEVLELGENGTMATGACVGGRGRYLFATVLKRPQILMFDLARAQPMRAIPWPPAVGPMVRLVAGADVLVALDGATGKMTSWDLGKLEEPAEATLRGFGAFLLMGSETNGPLIVSEGGTPTRAFDPITLKPVEYDTGTPAERKEFDGAYPVAIDSTGTVLAMEDTLHSPRSLFFRKIGPGTLHPLAVPRVPSGEMYALSAGGGHLMMPEKGVRLADGKPSDRIPAVSERSVRAFSVDARDERIASAPWPRGPGATFEISLWKPGQKGPLARLLDDPAAMEMTRKGGGYPCPPVLPGRLFCVAEWNLVVVVGNDRVWVWHADPDRQKPMPK